MRSIVFSLILSSIPAFASGGTVLYIGDSHSVGSFGASVLKTLGAKHSVKRYAVGSTTADDWSKNAICARTGECRWKWGFADPQGVKGMSQRPSGMKGFAGLVADEKPDAVVIALGTNDAVAHCKKDLNKYAGVQKLLNQVPKDKPCVWIGPPNFPTGRVNQLCGARYRSYVDGLQSAVEKAGCRYIDSRGFKNGAGQPLSPDGSDRIHFALQGKLWGQRAAELALGSLGGAQGSPGGSRDSDGRR